MKKPLFTGCGTALVTPFRGGLVDGDALRRLIDFQIVEGADALVVCATTGEAPTLSLSERAEVIGIARERAAGRIPVIVGTGANDTARACALSRAAQELGADGVLVVTPYYNKATQAGLVQHFTAVADAVEIPVILYNVPARTGVSCTAETYAALADHPNILGVKEASGSFSLVQETRNLCPPDFYLWSGNDEDTAALMLLGGVGVISVASNVAPRAMHDLAALCLSGRFREAGEAQLALTELIRALFCEVNPIPVKAALAAMGLCAEELRLPLCPISDLHRERLYAALSRCGIESPAR